MNKTKRNLMLKNFWDKMKADLTTNTKPEVMPVLDHNTTAMTTFSNSFELFDTYKLKEEKDSDEESFHLPLDDDDEERRFNGIFETEDEILDKYDLDEEVPVAVENTPIEDASPKAGSDEAPVASDKQSTDEKKTKQETLEGEAQDIQTCDQDAMNQKEDVEGQKPDVSQGKQIDEREEDQFMEIPGETVEMMEVEESRKCDIDEIEAASEPRESQLNKDVYIVELDKATTADLDTEPVLEIEDAAKELESIISKETEQGTKQGENDDDDLFDISIIKDAQDDNEEENHSEDDKNDEKHEEYPEKTDESNDKTFEEEEMDIEKTEEQDQSKSDDVDIEESNLKEDCDGSKDESETNSITKTTSEKTETNTNNIVSEETIEESARVLVNADVGEKQGDVCVGTDVISLDSPKENGEIAEQSEELEKHGVKRHLSDQDGEEMEVTKKAKCERKPDKEPDTKILKTLGNIAEFMRSKDTNRRLTRQDLEEFCLQKICEAVAYKCEVGELQKQLKAYEQIVETMRKEILQISKQARDLEIVNKKILSDMKAPNAQKPLNPLRITRSVGLQVKFTPMFDNGIKRRPPPQQNVLITSKPNQIAATAPIKTNNRSVSVTSSPVKPVQIKRECTSPILPEVKLEPIEVKVEEQKPLLVPKVECEIGLLAPKVEVKQEDVKYPIDTYLPSRSRNRYERCYQQFLEWCRKNDIKNVATDTAVIAYFDDIGQDKQPSTLWSAYSRLRKTLRVKHKIDISKYARLAVYNKHRKEYYKPKNAGYFTKNDIQRFLTKAPLDFLPYKVILIIAVCGSCRSEDLCKMKLKDIQFVDETARIILRDEQTNDDKSIFDIDEPQYINVIKQYLELRKDNDNDRFFLQIKNGVVTNQFFGRGAFAIIARRIATYLKLKNVSSFTAHCFKRTATMLVREALKNKPPPAAKAVQNAQQPKQVNGQLLSQALQPRNQPNKPPQIAARPPTRAAPIPSVIDLTDEDDKRDKAKIVPKVQCSTGGGGGQTKNIVVRTPGIRTTNAPVRLSSPQVVTSTQPVMYVVQSPTGTSLNPNLAAKAVVVNFQPNGTLSAALNGSPLSVLPKAQNITATPRVSKGYNKHPAPLPIPPVVRTGTEKLKPIPPKPHLTIRKTDTGIILQWKMPYELEMYEVIASYQLYAYQETNGAPSTDMWRKIISQPRKTLTPAERLQKKREAERLRYQKIKNDPEKYELFKQKENEKYLRKKEKGIIKTVKQMTPSEQLEAKEKWKEKAKRQPYTE